MIKKNFYGLMVNLASPQDIKNWSHGYVESPDTINYRTGKPKQRGLFCEITFGPMRNYECSCGKYKGVRYKGIICEKCGVEVASSRVRRERMGHIELSAPVAHVWYYKATPSRIGLLLNLSVKEIEKILYFVKYIIIDIDEERKKNAISNLDKDFENKQREIEKAYKSELEDIEQSKSSLSNNELKIRKEEIEKLYSDNKSKLEKDFSVIKSKLASFKIGSTILESDYRNIFYKYEGIFKFMSGSLGILYLLERVNIENEIKDLLKIFNSLKGLDRDKAFKKLRMLINLHISGVKPEWMVLKYLPVIPPDLRPVVQLEGGKFASSDINLYYRRVLMRNIRLKKMIEAGMPDVIKKNEIRLLQESVNNLVIGDNESSGRVGAGVKVFKSLTDMLSGKEGIFRKNLLGKRVDYSGRSVITVGPKLKLDECGLPLYIAVRIFSPFIIGKLLERKICHTPKQAEKLIKDENPIALKILEEVIKDKYVLLNRAPTLHRLGIQGFKIKLMPGKTIRIHPLVCPAFNADFDGDQMAVHLPLSEESQKEAKELISADKNILKPASGEPIITHTLDMILGIYFLTDDTGKTQNPVGIFESLEKVKESYNSGNLGLKDLVKVKFNGEYIISTTGRVLFNIILPEKLRFINDKISKKQLKSILDRIFNEYGMEETVRIADTIKDMGFEFSTKSAVTMNVFDLIIPNEKNEILRRGDDNVNFIHNAWYSGFLSDDEKHISIIQIWIKIRTDIENIVKKSYSPGNNIFTLVDSGAKGNWSQLTQLAGMKGLIASPSGEIVELPVKSCLLEGFAPIEYFISAHGARKGKADTALRTAESGYLTRRLVDASQDCIIREEDCFTTDGVLMTKEEATLRGESFNDLLYGRTLLQDIVDQNGNVLIKNGDIIDNLNLKIITNLELNEVKVRNPITCKTSSGVCQKCYGIDLSTRKVIDIGTAIGVISSQSIGELGTQLTMRTFHMGGTASADGDITQGIKRVEELFEVRRPKKPAIVSPFDGEINVVESGKLTEIEVISENEPKVYIIKDSYKIKVKKGDYMKKGGVYASKGNSYLKVKDEGKILDIKKDHIILGVMNKSKKVLSFGTSLKVKDGDKVYKGQIISSGALDIREYKQIVGDLEAQKYIVREIKKVYNSQGQDINDKYVEIIVKQLFSKVIVEDSGDSSFIPGSIIKYEDYLKINIDLEQEGKQPCIGKRLIFGLTQIAKETESWLSSASFQETMRVMVDSSTRGSIDMLDDLKANVIIGRLLPLGDEFKKIVKGKLDNDQNEFMQEGGGMIVEELNQ